MKNLIDNIYAFNKERGLISEYDTKREVSMIFEELLELFEGNNPKEDARELVEKSFIMKKPIEDDREIVDAYIDIIYIAVGSLIKKYNSILPIKNKEYITKKLILKAIDNVVEANKKKNGEKDINGKFIKDKNFIKPFIPLNLNEIINGG